MPLFNETPCGGLPRLSRRNSNDSSKLLKFEDLNEKLELNYCFYRQ
jgi:hypothetical protein